MVHVLLLTDNVFDYFFIIKCLNKHELRTINEQLINVEKVFFIVHELTVNKYNLIIRCCFISQ